MALHRRTLLRSTALPLLGAVAGCSRLDGDDFSVTDLWVRNETRSRTTITIAAQTDSETAFRETLTLDADESRRFENPLADETTYEIHVRVENGPSATYEWKGEHRDNRGVWAHVHGDRIEFQAVVH